MPEAGGYEWSSWDDVDGRTDRSEDEILSIPVTWDGDMTVRFGWGSIKFSWITGVARGTGLRRGEVTNFSLFPWLEYNTVFTRILEDPAMKHMHIVNFKWIHFYIAKFTKKFQKDIKVNLIWATAYYQGCRKTTFFSYGPDLRLQTGDVSHKQDLSFSSHPCSCLSNRHYYCVCILDNFNLTIILIQGCFKICAVFKGLILCIKS